MKKLTFIIFLSIASYISASENKIIGDPQAGKGKAAMCSSCHGSDGNSRIPTYPKLAGQNEKYIINQLKAFKQGAKGPRNNGMMQGMSSSLSEQDMHDISAYYAKQTVRPGTAKKSAVEQGQKLYRGGNMENKIASCQGCHGPQGKGNFAAGFPALAGQHATYTTIQLKAFRKGQRQHEMMQDVSKRLTDEEIEAVAQYIQGLH